MNFFKRIIGLFGWSAWIIPSAAVAADYAVGQVWSYNTRAGEESSRLIIVAMTPMPDKEIAFSIFVEGVRLNNPHIEGGIQDHLPHAPITKSALDSSVRKLIETRSKLPDYKEGFTEWKSAFDEGDGGVFSVTVAEILTFIERVAGSVSQ